MEEVIRGGLLPPSSSHAGTEGEEERLEAVPPLSLLLERLPPRWVRREGVVLRVAAASLDLGGRPRRLLAEGDDATYKQQSKHSVKKRKIKMVRVYNKPSELVDQNQPFP